MPDNLSLIDCYLYAIRGLKAVIDNGKVTGFLPEPETGGMEKRP